MLLDKRAAKHVYSWIPWNLSFRYILFQEKRLQTMLWHHNARVNSHQRWKQMRLRICFHLWCELTSTMNVTEWQFSWNSCNVLMDGLLKFLSTCQCHFVHCILGMLSILIWVGVSDAHLHKSIPSLIQCLYTREYSAVVILFLVDSWNITTVLCYSDTLF